MKNEKGGEMYEDDDMSVCTHVRFLNCPNRFFLAVFGEKKRYNFDWCFEIFFVAFIRFIKDGRKT